MLKHQPRSFDGWALDAAIEAERAIPGFLVWLVGASGLKRQTAFLLLALQRETGGPEAEGLAALGSLRSERARNVLRTALGTVPEGLVGVLGRLSPEPLPRAYYRRLCDLLGERSPRARALLQVPGTITLSMIRAAFDLDQAAVHPTLIEASRESRALASINMVMDWARSVVISATDDRLRESVGRLRGDPRRLVRRWSAALDRLPYKHPIDADDPDFCPLLTGRDFIEAARRFRNCLKTQIAPASVGQAAFAVTRQGVPVAVQLRPLTNGWVLQEGWLERNERPPAPVMIDLRRKLRARGIHTFAFATDRDDRIMAFGGHMFGFADGDTTPEVGS